MPGWTQGYTGDSAWPKGAVPGSVFLALVSLAVCLWGVGRAPSPVIAGACALAGLIAGYLALKTVTDRWLAGDREEAFAWKVVAWSLAIAVPLGVLALVPPTRPYAVAAFGAAVVGLMAANLRAIRREGFRRERA